MSLKNPRESSLLTLSPYPVQENEAGLTFETHSGIRYQLAFESNAKEFPHSSFGENCVTLSIIPLKGYNRRRSYEGLGDPRIEITVMGQLLKLFDLNPLLIINYSCDLTDELERHRNIIFGRWYLTHLEPNGVARQKHINTSERIYAAVLYRESNPHRHELEETFSKIFRGK